MKIMCLNGWGGKLHTQLLPYLKKSQPDVLCLQEVVHTPSSDKSDLTYRDLDIELSQRAQFFTDVSAVLPDHIAVFCPAAQGDLWDGNTRYHSLWGLATFVHKSLPIIAQAQGFVHKGFSADGYGEHPRSRSAHAVRFYNFDLNRAFTVSHMHGLRDLAGKHDTPERLNQARRLRDLTFSVAQQDDGVIVCGDFNVHPDSKTFTILTAAGLTELVTSRGFTSTRNSHYRKPEKFADYMMVDKSLLHADFDVVYTPEVSDHCPLILSVTDNR